MRDQQVASGSGVYPLRYVPGGSDQWAEAVLGLCPQGRLFVVTDERVWPLHGEDFVRRLQATGREVFAVVLAGGESGKHLESVTEIWDRCLEAEIQRADTLVAFGGGVIGDLTAFAASTLLRGVSVIQMPTTLLAMADASIGGKTGFNRPQGKNLIGTFWPPKAVLVPVATLATLDAREIRSGLAEVVKSAWLSGEVDVAWLEQSATGLRARELTLLSEAARRAASLKIAIVSDDEREADRRRWLNFGHTFGHAIEQIMGYGVWTHGEAVAVGMVMAQDLAVSLGIADARSAERLRLLLGSLDLPIETPALPIEALRRSLGVDKKRRGDEVTFVLTRKPGETLTYGLSWVQVGAWLERRRSGS